MDGELGQLEMALLVKRYGLFVTERPHFHLDVVLTEQVSFSLFVAVHGKQVVLPVPKVAQQLARLIPQIAERELGMMHGARSHPADGLHGERGFLQRDERSIELFHDGRVALDVLEGGGTAVHKEEVGVAVLRQFISCKGHSALQQVVTRDWSVQWQLGRST